MSNNRVSPLSQNPFAKTSPTKPEPILIGTITVEAGERTKFYEVDAWYTTYEIEPGEYPLYASPSTHWLAGGVVRYHEVFYVAWGTITGSNYSAQWAGGQVSTTGKYNTDVGQVISETQRVELPALRRLIDAGKATITTNAAIPVFYDFIPDSKVYPTLHLYKPVPGVFIELLQMGISEETALSLAGVKRHYSPWVIDREIAHESDLIKLKWAIEKRQAASR